MPVASPSFAAALSAELPGRVHFDAGTRALYATDASNYRQVPLGVVFPRTTEDVLRAVELCREHDLPLLTRGGGTSLAGQACNEALLLDFSRWMNRVVSVDPEERLARVQPGLVLDALQAALKPHKLTFAPDPATHSRCTLGGMIGNNSCGAHSIMSGRTSDNIRALDVLTYDGLRLEVGPTTEEDLARMCAEDGRRGEIYRRLREIRDTYAEEIRARFPRIPRRVSGYNLDELLPENGFNVARALVGSEGTCVTLLEATLQLVASPPARCLVVIGYPDVCAAAEAVPRVMEQKPVALEGWDGRMVDYMVRKRLYLEYLPLLPEGRGWLLAETAGDTPEEARQKAEELAQAVGGADGADRKKRLRVYQDAADQAHIWEVRESGLGVTAYVPGRPMAWAGWEDAAVDPAGLGAYLRDFTRLCDGYDYDYAYYGHFGDGCVHVRFDFDLESRPGIDKYRRFVDDCADLVVRYGGSLSGEHGDGQARSELLPKMFGPTLMRAFEEFKDVWDPQNRMNPDRIARPSPLTDNLRLGTHYDPPALRTQFAYTEDGGSFANATLRCVGIGKCRRESGGTMCPSYMVTRQEQHSTRGRAHLLFEMLEGNPLGGGWRNDSVREALDLCLACKGCKSECPVNVDMATYKAEFLSHYYAGRLRPRSAYAFGLIMYWARLGGRVPRLVNAFTHAPVLSTLAKRFAGMDARRTVPAFAEESFQAWSNRRVPANLDGPQVVLWPDTFNNYFHVSTAQAAVEVLESQGFRVLVPQGFVCCGRPLYDYGLLDLARSQLRGVLRRLRPLLRAGVPVVGLEPSCISVFRDELVQMLPQDADARRLRDQSFALGEFLDQHGFKPDRPLQRQALVHGHCHHKAVLSMGSEEAVLRSLGLDVTVLDSGCCGMAGAFGFEEGEHCSVSLAAGERVLLPAVRSADAQTLVVADGFSCREQITQCTDRHALHLAEVARLAIQPAANVAFPT